MRVTYDEAKRERTFRERGLDFRDAEWVFAGATLEVEDTRKDYGETRIQVLAFLGNRLHAAVITIRGDALHVISFRKANRKEVKWYERERG